MSNFAPEIKYQIWIKIDWLELLMYIGEIFCISYVAFILGNSAGVVKFVLDYSGVFGFGDKFPAPFGIAQDAFWGRFRILTTPRRV